MDVPWLPLLAVLLVAHPGVVAGFNVDVDRAVTYTAGDEGEGPDRPQGRSMFGFATTQHVNTKGEARILVGAPRANTSQPGITEGGAVYDCHVDGNIHPRTISCQVMVFDTTGNRYKSMAHFGDPDELYEEKSGQWFGATVVSAKNKSSGTLMACAPRYQYCSKNRDKRLPIGICYYYNGLTNNVTVLNPLEEDVDKRTDKKHYELEQMLYWGKSQYGSSAAITRASTSMLVGSPGSFNWAGRFLVHTSTDPLHPKRSTVRGDIPAYIKKDTYFGYSVAFGNFTASNELDFVVGAPKGGTALSKGPGTLSGTIRVFDSDLQMRTDMFTGKQMGQYLGYALAVGDFNGDGLDDIAAGAPFYSVQGSYNTGRVLILTQTKIGIIYRGKRKYLEGHRRTGEMFGVSLAVIGDINQDGFTDLAVGAPYGGKEGHGAVYIFHGSSHGLKCKISQMIDAASFSDGLRTFGFSLSGGLDMDNNGYPDITVGGYESGNIVQLWSRPILRLYVNLTVPPIIDVEQTNIQAKGMNPTKFFVKIRHSHRGNDPLATTKLNITVRLDSDRKTAQRAYFLNEGSRTPMSEMQVAIYNIQGESSISLPFYMKSAVIDKLSPFIVEVQYKVTSEHANGLAPIFDVEILTTIRAEITIKKNCGPDRTCIPDLSLTAKPVMPSFDLGSPTMDVMVTVENLELDDAFEAKVSAHLPPGTQYQKVYKKSPVAVRCSPVTTHETDEMEIDTTEMTDSAKTVICEIGNPQPGKTKVEFTLQFDANNVDGSFDQLTFDFSVSSSNPENATTLHNNRAHVTMPVHAVTPLRISGTSKPEQVIFAPDGDTGKPKGQTPVNNSIIHLYEVQNLGSSTVKTANVTIYWPSRFPDNQGELFVLTAANVEQGGKVTKCSTGYAALPAQNITGTPVVQRFTNKLLQEKTYNKKVVCTAGGGESWCTIIKCRVGHLGPEDRALVRIKAQLSHKSLSQLPHMTILVMSVGEAQVDSLPYTGIIQTSKKTDPVAVNTFLATKGPGKGGIQWWIVAVAVAGGIILLIILTRVLYKVGFFKRKQYGDDDAMSNSVADDNSCGREYEDDEDQDDMFARFAEGEAGNRNSRIDTVNRKLVFQNGISISIEERR